jgi:transcriptional regulator with XRE-family HTH domain
MTQPAKKAKPMFERLGLCLRTFREMSGISQASLAREAGIGKSQLSKYENGKELPKLDSLGKVLSILDVSPLTFFYGLAILEKGFDPQNRVGVELLRSESTGSLFRAQEAAGLRSLFEQFLHVFEMAVEGRILDRIPHGHERNT